MFIYHSLAGFYCSAIHCKVPTDIQNDAHFKYTKKLEFIAYRTISEPSLDTLNSMFKAEIQLDWFLVNNPQCKTCFGFSFNMRSSFICSTNDYIRSAMSTSERAHSEIKIRILKKMLNRSYQSAWHKHYASPNVKVNHEIVTSKGHFLNGEISILFFE